MSKHIPLSQGKLALIDDDDFETHGQVKWHAMNHGRRTYAVRNVRVGLHSKAIYLHRQIMNAPKGMDVDHINGDTLDNRKCNLRICTRSENLRNRPKDPDNTSGYKGVHWSKKYNKWQSKIVLQRKTIHLGFFDDPIEAARAYDAKAKEIHGEFAFLNFQ